MLHIKYRNQLTARKKKCLLVSTIYYFIWFGCIHENAFAFQKIPWLQEYALKTQC